MLERNGIMCELSGEDSENVEFWENSGCETETFSGSKGFSLPLESDGPHELIYLEQRSYHMNILLFWMSKNT